MGADCLAEFHRWRQWRQIMDDDADRRHRPAGLAAEGAVVDCGHGYIAARLPEHDAGRLASMRPPAWVFLTAPLSDLSSTAIRAGKAR